MSAVPTSALEFHKKCACGTSGTDPIHALVPRKSYPLYHHFHPQLGHTSIRLVLHITHRSCLLTSNLIPVYYKNMTQGHN